VPQMLAKPEVVQILSHATVFVCPSLYEPMGIVNLEAMACQTAVVATATGGIPEVVVDASTGLLVAIDQDSSGTPVHPDRFVTGLAEAITALLDDPDRASAMGWAGRERAVQEFSWDSIAQATVQVYRGVVQQAEPAP
jgi:alpha-maltose-1-phosphate synthase